MRLLLLLFLSVAVAADEYWLREPLTATPSGAADAAWQAEIGGSRPAPGNRQAAGSTLLVTAGRMSWEFPEIATDSFVECFIRPAVWDGNSAEAVEILTVRVGDITYTVAKAADEPSLVLQRDETVVQRYPIYNWLEEPWHKQHPEGAWHYLNIAVTADTVDLRVDGFRAATVASAAGGHLRGLSLAGGPGTAFSWLHVVGGSPPRGDALRARFRALFRGLPDLHANTVTIPHAAAAPKIDGEVSPGEWDNAARLSGFTAPKGGLRAEDLHVLATYDDRYVYLLFRTPYTGDLRTRKHEKWDAPLWGEESYEIFLHPPFTGVPIYVQLVGNPSGNQADLQVMNLEWDGRWDWRPQLRNGEWIAEFRAEFRGIDAMPPGEGARWTGNFINTFAGAQWAKTQRYHDTGAFGVLHFAADAPIIRPGHMQVTDTAAIVPLDIRANGAARSLDVGLQVYAEGDVLPADISDMLLELGANESRELRLEVPRGDIEKGTIAVYVREGEREHYYHQVTFPVSPPVERQGWPQAKSEAAARATVKESEETELSDEQRAYRRQWTAEELGQTLKDSARWVDNTIGLDDTVAPPWTPMTVNGATVGCWGRQMVYDRALFPRQITSLGAPLLTAAPRLRLAGGGAEWTFADAEVTAELLDETQVRVRAEASAGPLTVTTDTTWEFDGMGWVTLTVACPDDPTMIDRAVLEVPLRADRTGLYHVMVQGQGHAPNTTSDITPAEVMSLDTFRHLLWFGDHRRGLCWFAEGMQNWQIEDESAIQVLAAERNGERVLRLKLAEKPFTIDRPWTIEFGLQATPMKPRDPDFRFRADRSRASVWCWFWGDGDYYPFQSTHVDKAREQIAKARAEGREVMPCSSLTYFGRYRMHKAYFGELDQPGLMHRELLIWGPQWLTAGDHIDLAGLPERHTAPDGWYGKKFEPRGQSRLSPASPWQDFYIWKLDELVRETGLGAIYLDQNLWGSRQRSHGCGYIDYRGEWAASWPVRSWRRMVQRINRILVDAHGRSLIRWHSSNQIAPPILSFADVIWDGENYAHGQHKVFEFYSRVLPPGRMQAQHTGLQFGWAPDLLPELEGRYAPSPASERDMFGWFTVHDSGVDNAHCVQGHMVRWLRDRLAEERGQPESTHYYWEAENLVQLAGKEIYHIVYRQPEGVVVLLFNRTDAPATATLRAGGELTALTAIDAFGGAALGVGPTWSVPLQPRDFRLLRLQPVSKEN